jgi:hypothetical protein
MSDTNRKRPYTQELVNTYDALTDSLNLGTADIAKILGRFDLYRDSSDSDDPNRIEKALAVLEGKAARIIQVVDDAVQKGLVSVALSRADVNTLRKFLFIVKFRQVGHAQTFIDDDWDSQETALMVDMYRQKHNLPDSWAVYLRTVSLLLEDEHWEVFDDQRLLRTARQDYRMDSTNMQLSFYVAHADVPFVLTNGGLGLWEGAHAALPLSYIYAVTPRLVIMLRTGMGGAFDHMSFFSDFPKTKAQTVYSPPIDRQQFAFLREDTAEARQKRRAYLDHGLVDGVHMQSRLSDRFTFTLHALTGEQADRVNTLMMTHVDETIIFMDKTSISRAITAFENDRRLMTAWDPRKRRFESLKNRLRDIPSLTAPPASPTLSAQQLMQSDQGGSRSHPPRAADTGSNRNTYCAVRLEDLVKRQHDHFERLQSQPKRGLVIWSIIMFIKQTFIFSLAALLFATVLACIASPSSLDHGQTSLTSACTIT